MKIVYNDCDYEITRVKKVQNCCPKNVGCIAPVEYSVVIERQDKLIYFEPSTNKWFSVKEVYE